MNDTYKNDTPEQIFARNVTTIDSWLSTPGGYNSSTDQLAYTVLKNGVLYSGHWSRDILRLQRPALHYD